MTINNFLLNVVSLILISSHLVLAGDHELGDNWIRYHFRVDDFVKSFGHAVENRWHSGYSELADFRCLIESPEINITGKASIEIAVRHSTIAFPVVPAHVGVDHLAFFFVRAIADTDSFQRAYPVGAGFGDKWSTHFNSFLRNAKEFDSYTVSTLGVIEDHFPVIRTQGDTKNFKVSVCFLLDRVDVGIEELIIQVTKDQAQPPL